MQAGIACKTPQIDRSIICSTNKGAQFAAGNVTRITLTRCTRYYTSHLNRHAVGRPTFNRFQESVVCSAESSYASTSVESSTQKQGYRLVFGAKLIPHPDKAHYGGEDAYFISDHRAGCFGVADGVGGWQESGINPGDYSKEFMEWSRQYLEGALDNNNPIKEQQFNEEGAAATDSNNSATPTSETSSSTANIEPMISSSSTDEVSSTPTQQQQQNQGPKTALEALRVAHKLTRKPGSSTVLVAQLDGTTGKLDAANLGDSGFLLIRQGGEVAFQTPALQHFFDCPFQFGCAPEFTPATDTADDADVFNIQLYPGDVLIAGSDGLLDNCWPEEIASLAPSSSSEVQASAEKLAALAMEHGQDPDFESPYVVEAAQDGIDVPIWEKLANASFKGGKFQLGGLSGGKLDDVTVVVAYVEKIGTVVENTGTFENTEFA